MPIGKCSGTRPPHLRSATTATVNGNVHVQAEDAAVLPMLNSPFSVVEAGAACHEIRDGHGEVIAWAADRARAFVIAGLLEHACR